MKLTNTSTFKKKKQLPLILLVVAVVALYAPLLASIAVFSAEVQYVPEQKQIVLKSNIEPITTFPDIGSLEVEKV